jgi:ribonuclease HII
MAILAGIDEAGFGPILGPLVISSAAFSIDESQLDADLWQILNKSVGVTRKHLAGRLLICDSKKAYNKQFGIKHLQRTTLASLKTLGKEPENLTDLIKILCPDYLNQLDIYPWYKNVGGYCISADRKDIDIASGVFNNDLFSNGMLLLELKSNCLDVEFYNRMISNVKNKSSVLFTAVSQLILSAWEKYSSENLQIIIDRQGGRVHYRRHLQRMFEGLELIILKETENLSSYELRDKGRTMRLHFVVGADRKFLPVSLSSMVSKYLRELMIDNLNNYFRFFNSSIKPTAGYWTDGLRFVKDIQTFIPQISYNSNQLIRSR